MRFADWLKTKNRGKQGGETQDTVNGGVPIPTSPYRRLDTVLTNVRRHCGAATPKIEVGSQVDQSLPIDPHGVSSPDQGEGIA